MLLPILCLKNLEWAMGRRPQDMPVVPCLLSPVSCPRRGMTLIELLLAATLFALMLIATAALVRSSLQAQNRWGILLEPYQRMERAIGRLEQDLESAQVFFGVPVSGTNEQLEFARVESVAIAEGKIAPEWIRVVYRIKPQGDQMALVRDVFLWRAGKESKPMQEDTLLPVSNGHFAYGALDKNQKLVWSEGWDEKNKGIPRLFKFDYTLSSAGNQSAVALSRVVRNPSGVLPVEETP